MRTPGKLGVYHDTDRPGLCSMQSEGNANHFVSIGLNFGILLISIFPTWIVLSELEHSHEIRVTEDGSSHDEEVADADDASDK
jgi:hypothetical protein